MKHQVYISLGSNIGDRKSYLQSATNAINQQIGSIVKVSPIYETPAWGFTSNNFYNICLLTETTLSPEKTLQKLLSIEKELGRVRNANTESYQPRSIDLDILFFDDKIIKTEDLQIPHPQIQNRKFVLFPLADIAPEKKHPTLQQSVEELIKNTNDTSQITKISDKISIPNQNCPFRHYNYIAIEGNIGSGKTTLSTKIAEDFNVRLILERFSDNPFLPKFYENPKQYGFTLEMSFLTERYQQMSEQLAQTNLFKPFIVSDYDIFKSLIFSQVTLTEDEFVLYRKLFYILYNQIVKPDLYIFLYQSTDRLIENIKKRGRTYEQNISKEYLNQIHHGYLDFIQKNNDVNSLIIDVTELDFVKNQSDYEFIIEKISNFSRETSQK
ncbi:2-amino-4-hydroxy-6-hydroxymethyldihydropteridine diphosphokinase [Capnocytophaga cynodegmi]|uniref:2-amino-4-hydroxy-6- hydroxymethyldihydropteridine diphosphokinase n=1 Tax=Capnocytophaga cynodegmi TaxID=28189 RepID=UPI0003A65586|nr:2-amino-4-hydroxy-6-hydroxymethyldihydropteridine diphosphokinase [Capnocytophaga cynodegmi]CEN40986.1 2-amino-4-hydroxy-6-hydroxymethyldihydropteridinediphosphokinase [Capnocytophaga cynodegmi]